MDAESRGDSDARLRSLLAETLGVWGVDGRVDPAEVPAVARVHALGTSILVERAAPGDAFRWYLRHQADETGQGGRAARPCGSLVGVLSGLRRMLGLESGTPVRVVR